jgi:large subunit ribosomal protein L17
MRKLKKGRKFGRESSVRKAFLKSLITALISHKKITTTRERAKEISPLVQKAVTKAKKGDIASVRLLRKDLSEETVKKLLEIAKSYQDRKGGYVRIVNKGQRRTDGAMSVIIEFV